MGVMHKKYNVHGVQFHPESIKTHQGMILLKNFLKYQNCMKNSENLINKISKGKNLTFEESKSIFLDIMSGKMEEKSI